MLKPKIIEAVTVCVNYSDFLSVVIPYNLPMLDRWIIVTDPSDEETQELCRKYGLECLRTEDGKDYGDFAKSRMIERALQHLSATDWHLHIDADIVLPRHFKQLIDIADLQKDIVYGVDRIMVKSWEQWEKLKATRYLEGGQYSFNHSINFPKGFEIGSRWGSSLTGWTPIGFFQLAHISQIEWRGVRFKSYPRCHNSACRTDVQYGLQWDRKKRQLIPEIIVVHLSSEACANGTNWKGRKTKPFGFEEKPTLGIHHNSNGSTILS